MSEKGREKGKEKGRERVSEGVREGVYQETLRIYSITSSPGLFCSKRSVISKLILRDSTLSAVCV